MAFCIASARLPIPQRAKAPSPIIRTATCCLPHGDVRTWLRLCALPVSTFREFQRKGRISADAVPLDTNSATIAVGVPESATVAETVAYLCAVAPTPPAPDCVFVVHDSTDKVVGHVPLADLLLCAPDYHQERLGCFARENSHVVLATDTVNAVAVALAVAGTNVAPVVDEHVRLIGIARSIDVARLAAGGGNAPYFANRISSLILSRAPWLVTLLILQSASSAILGQFADLIEHNVLLTFFLTMIVGSAGNSGSQSAAMLIAGLARGEIDARNDFWRVMRRELVIAAALGLLLAVIAFLRVMILGGSEVEWISAFTIALALLLTVVAASVMASATPMLLKLLGVDPTLGSGPALSTLTDICGVVLLCTTATLLLHG